jgi:hypothetical protein
LVTSNCASFQHTAEAAIGHCFLSTVLGRRREAEGHFDRLLALCNDVGLLSEELGKVWIDRGLSAGLLHIGLLHAAR